MKFNSIRFKISVLYTSILGAVLIVYSAVLFLTLSHALYTDLDQELHKKASALADTIGEYRKVLGNDPDTLSFILDRVIRQEGTHPRIDKVRDLDALWQKKLDKFGLKFDYISAGHPGEPPMLTSRNLPPKFVSKLMDSRLSGAASYRNVQFKKRKFRQITFALPDPGDSPFEIRIASSLKPIIQILQNRLVAISITIPLVLLSTGFIGRIFSASILAPVREITRTARHITSSKDLGSRVRTEHGDEEITNLVSAFNDMISRLDRSFRYIADFSSNVAHELRTPLAIIKGESEVALRKERASEEYRRVIRQNIEESERMLKTIEDLFLLAKLDYRPEVFQFKRIELIAFIREIHEQARVLALSKNIETRLEIPERKAWPRGDRLHLRRLFYNLIHNAVKFTPPEGLITIAVHPKNDSTVEIAVRDTGIGIPPERISRVFDRFFHADSCDRNADPGNGLGLSIALSIARMHGGNILVESAPGEGSEFRVILPGGKRSRARPRPKEIKSF
jgi:heavy metal sensor kinase